MAEFEDKALTYSYLTFNISGYLTEGSAPSTSTTLNNFDNSCAWFLPFAIHAKILMHCYSLVFQLGEATHFLARVYSQNIYARLSYI